MAEYTLITSDEAIEDLALILDEYNRLNERLAERFFNQYVLTRNSLLVNPQRFREVFLFVRRAFIPNFPYKVYFVVSEATLDVEVIGVLHQKRDERVLRKRLNFE